jgi:hypothetical protein
MSSALPSAAVMPSAAMPLRWSSQESAASVSGDPFQPRAAASVLNYKLAPLTHVDREKPCGVSVHTARKSVQQVRELHSEITLYHTFNSRDPPM